MRILSPCKINLHLRVGPPGFGGYHPLLSWMCTVGLADILDLTLAQTPGITLHCDKPDVPLDGTNLIVRAGEALAAECNIAKGALVKLQKKIPMGGGLGGGSSNGAFALVALNKLWSADCPPERLAKLAASLGSDVPFFLHGPSSVCTGRGERVKPIDRPAAKFVLLMFPSFSMSTPDVYHQFDDMKLGVLTDTQRQPDWAKWTILSALELLPVLVNDLEAPAFDMCPDLGMLRTEAESALGRIVRMSGSGSTLFTLFDEQPAAHAGIAVARKLGVSAAAFALAPASQNPLA
jgi:4-diphosphocytidyl-2-C-methyl-D-erythritol kinase